jgi:hypothetical protein
VAPTAAPEVAVMRGRNSQWFPEVWTQLALPQLGEDHDADSDRWSFAVVSLDRHGRLTLPGAARMVLGEAPSLRVLTRGDAVVVRGGDGVGRAVHVDARGRLVVPVWLRHATQPNRSVLVATRTCGDVEPIVLLVAPRVLVGLADLLVGER